MGNIAEGVSFETESTDEVAELAIPFHAIGGIPSRSSLLTDRSGYGGLVNVPSGEVTLRAILEDGTRRVIGSVTVVVQPDSLTIVGIAPADW